MSRTFELAPNGRELDETLRIDLGSKAKNPLVIRYAYAIAATDMAPGEDTDPDRPILKRHSDDSDSSTRDSSDPNVPVLKRQPDDNSANPSDDTNDPNVPVLKHADSNGNPSR